MKKLLTIAVVALMMTSCKKESIQPEPTVKIDTTSREFKIVSLNKIQTWSVMVNDQKVTTTLIDTLNSTYVSTRFYLHKNDVITFKDSGVMENRLYIFTPNVPIRYFSCDCEVNFTFTMN